MLSRDDYFNYRRMMRMKKFFRASKAFLFLAVVLMSVIFIYNFDLEFSKKVDMNDLIKSDEYLRGPDCENLSFQETAICLNDFARKYFFYNITDDSLTLSVQEMMERGGDCKDFTDFYERYMNHYGFNNTQRVRVFVEKNEDVSTYHVYLVVGHSSGYCNMDIRDLECYQYVNDDGEVKD